MPTVVVGTPLTVLCTAASVGDPADTTGLPVVLFLLAGVLAAFDLIFAGPLAGLRGHFAIRRFRRDLLRLPVEERAAVLLSLGTSVSRDTRPIVEPLLSDIDLLTEDSEAEPGSPTSSEAVSAAASLMQRFAIESLEEEIRVASQSTARFRNSLALLLVIAPLALWLPTVGNYNPGLPPELSPVIAFIELVAALGSGGILAAMVAVPAANLFRRSSLGRFKNLLERLPREQREEVLLPLRGAPSGDTRRIVEPLLSQLGLSSDQDLVPSEAPAGDGMEISPLKTEAR